jgi:methionine biosynthesis protein MetW
METKSYYETYWSPGGFRPTGRLREPLRELYERHIPPDSDCLDFGCGDGRTSGLWLSGHARSYVGLDVSANAVELAQEAGLDARVLEDGSHVPFDDRSFDAIVCIEVLEHVFEPQVVCSELLRVLRPGGTLIITVPNVAYWRRRLDFFVLGRWNPLGDERSVSQPWRDPHIRFFNRGSLTRLLDQTGFEDIKVGGHGGTLAGDIPLLRRVVRDRGGWAVEDWRPNPIYGRLEAALPGLLGYRLHAVASRPRR